MKIVFLLFVLTYMFSDLEFYCITMFTKLKFHYMISIRVCTVHDRLASSPIWFKPQSDLPSMRLGLVFCPASKKQQPLQQMRLPS